MEIEGDRGRWGRFLHVDVPTRHHQLLRRCGGVSAVRVRHATIFLTETRHICFLELETSRMSSHGVQRERGPAAEQIK